MRQKSFAVIRSVINHTMLSLTSFIQPLTMVETRTVVKYFSKITIHFTCFVFVVYQAHKCININKYMNYPKASHVSIQDAGSQLYPEITFCRNLRNSDYYNTLKDCNLTVEDYFDYHKWVGNTGPELYEQLSKNTSDRIPEFHIFGFNEFEVERFFPTDENMIIKEIPRLGRCLTYQFPKDKEIWMLKIKMDGFTELNTYLTTPADFLAAFDAYMFQIVPDYREQITIVHEVSKVLDFDGQSCESRIIRDQCVDGYIIRNFTEMIGCTTRFVSNKSNIGKDPARSLEAINMHLEIIKGNANNLAKVCPKSCTQVSSIVSDHQLFYVGDIESDYFEAQGSLKFFFPQFIKVSETEWSYFFLSLLAEVGGYVGLFLGISINQISSVLEKLLLYRIK